MPLQRLFGDYQVGPFYDEMFSAPGIPRPHYAKIFEKLGGMIPAQFEERRQLADLSFLLQGITFTVYSDGRGTERLFPFDLIPRIIPHSEWERIERGLAQRVMALNLFLQDVYGPQRILEGPQIPRSLVYSCQHFRREDDRHRSAARHPHPHLRHRPGARFQDRRILVLEDNVRTPSGISYVLENRLVMTRTFPDAFQSYEVLPVDHYPAELCQILRSLSPRGGNDAQIVLLTPGIYNSAYFEHSFLAQQMGIELVEGRDLIVDGDIVYMKTIHGLTRVDVIYRRIDDDFLDPLAFRAGFGAGRSRPDERLSRRQRGAGQRRRQRRRRRQGDLRLRARVHPLLPGRRPDSAQRRHVSVLQAGRSGLRARSSAGTGGESGGRIGGYGMLMGPTADRAAIEDFRERMKADPRNYIAQPVIRLSRVPSYDPAIGT